MASLRAQDTGLELWSAHCDAIADELTALARSSAPASAPSGQSTARAVGAAQAWVVATAAILADRVRATGIGARLSADAYATTDEQSAHDLSAAIGGRSA